MRMPLLSGLLQLPHASSCLLEIGEFVCLLTRVAA
jgi:hypothetical protein